MAKPKIRNVPLKDLIKFVEHCGFRHVKTKGGHLKFTKKGVNRPIIIQSHIDPPPHFVVSNCLKNMGKTKEDLQDFLTKNKSGKKGKGKNQ